MFLIDEEDTVKECTESRLPPESLYGPTELAFRELGSAIEEFSAQVVDAFLSDLSRIVGLVRYVRQRSTKKH